MKRLLISLMMLGAYSEALAQWTNVWPSWDYQREGKSQASQVGSAVVERVYAYDITPANTPTIPTWWRFQRSNLTGMKDDILTAIPYYINQYTTNAPNGAWTNGFDSAWGDNYAWTKTGICAYVELPTNYLDYTPWRCLNGRGPFGATNDNYGGIGHPYGWTNSSTAAGGANFAGGRTNVWYTTDYGWEGLKHIINELLWTHPNSSVVAGPNYYGFGKESNWVLTVAEAISDYKITGTNTVLTVVSDGRQIAGGYDLNVLNYLGYYKTPDLYTNAAHSVDFYGWSDDPYTSYTNQGTAFRIHISAVIELIAENTLGSVTSSIISPTNFPILCDEPPPNNSRGFIPYPNNARPIWDCVIKWDGANGFSYK